MPLINVEGVGLINFDDSMSREQITQAIERDILPQARASRQVSEEPMGPSAPAPIPERGFLGTIGARVGDVAGSTVSGLGGIASGLGGIVGIGTGSFDNPLTRLGQSIRGAGESLMSPELIQKRQLLDQALNEAEGQGFRAEVGAVVSTLAQNPGLLGSMAIEQIPQLLASFGIGRVATAAGQIAGRTGARAAAVGAERAAAEAGQRAGLAAAVGSGAGLQGGEVANQTYQDIMGLTPEVLNASPNYQALVERLSPEEARQQLATEGARLAGIMGGGISAGTMAVLPGAEKALLVGNAKRSIISRVLGTSGWEALQEGIEEGGGRASQNIAALRADVERDISRGVAGQAATGAALGAVLGGVSGAISRPGAQVTPPGAPPPPAAPPAPPVVGEPPPPVPPAPAVPGAEIPPAPVPPVTPAAPSEMAAPAAVDVPPVVEQPPAITEPPAVTEAPVIPAPQFVSFNVPVGTQFPVTTPPGPGGQRVSVDVVPEVVDLYSLIPASGRLQNRDINAKANELLISRIANRPDFAELTTSQYADRGAPVVGADNIVEVGNHRIAGLKKAAENNPEGFKAYVQSLQNAGYDTAGMQFPVLIRRRITDLDENQRVRFVKAANKSASQNLGPVELAREDAEALTDQLLAKFDGTVEAGIEAAKNRGFVNDFVNAISSGNDLNDFIDAKTGKLLPDGANRINRALFAAAYNDQTLLEKAINSSDDDLKSITGAMVNATPSMLAVRRGVESGRIREEFNIVPEIVRASDRIRSGRDRGMTPAEVLKIEDMMNPITPLEAALIRLMSNDAMTKVASKAAISRRLKAYAEEAATQTPDIDLVGGERRITPEQAVVNAINPEQTTMFSRGRPIENVIEPSIFPESAEDPIQEFSDRYFAPVVYQDKDFALLEGINSQTGAPLYFGVMSNGQPTRMMGSVVDVDKYSGPFVPKFILDRMREARKDAVARHNERAKQNPNGPIPEGSNIGFDKSFPDRLRGWTSELVKELGMPNAKIFFTTFSATTDSDFIDRNNLYGDNWTRARQAGVYRNAGYFGLTISQTGGDTYTVAIRDDLRLSEQIETLAHEIGHVFDKEAFLKAPDATVNQITAAFHKWLDKNQKLPTPQYLKLLRSTMVGRKIARGQPLGPAYKNLDSYYFSFSEWFADQVARWSLTSKPAETLMGRFFQRIAAAYRKIVAAMGDAGLPDQTVAKFIEDHRKRHLLSTDPTEAPMFDPVKTKGWTKKPKQLSMEFSAGTALTQAPGVEVEAIPGQTINVDGVERPTQNSAGRPIHPTAEGIRNFWRWFGDSKVVDEKGRPLVMYHGTLEDFNIFKLDSDRRVSRMFNRFGFWFDQSPATPNYFADASGGNVIPAYMSIKKPLVLKSEPLFIEDRKLLNRAIREGKLGEFNSLTKKLDREDSWDILMRAAGIKFTKDGKVDWSQNNEREVEARVEAFVNDLKSEGYDGIKLDDTLADAGSRAGSKEGSLETNWVIAFEPGQIKSAVGNQGQFSPSEIEIEASRGPTGGAQPPQPPGPTLLTPAPQQPTPPPPQPKLPLGSAADFYKAVIPEAEKMGLLDKVLSVLIDKKKGESPGAAIARTTINRAAGLYNADEMAAANGYTGRSAGRAMEMALTNTARVEQMLFQAMGRIDPVTGRITPRRDVKPLFTIMKDAGVKNPDDINELQVYLAALKERDLRKNGRQGFTNIPDGAVLDAINTAESKHPNWKQTAADIDKLNNALIDWSVDTGIISKDQSQKLRDVFYTPFYRIMEKDITAEPSRSVSPRIGESFTNVASAINRELKGGENPLGDLISNIILNADSIMKAGLKNLAMKTSAEVMEFAKLGKKNLTGTKNENTITYKVDGKDVAFDVEDAALFSALAGMPRTMQNGIYNTMAKMASIFRDFVTSAPSFIFSNLYKGKISAYVQEGQPFTTNTLAGVRDFLNASESAQNFALQTGFGGMEYGMEPRNMAKIFARKLTDEGIMKSLSKGKALSAIRQAYGKMQELSEATEMAERLKLSENLVKKGMSQEDADFQGYLLAPYSRRGTGEGWLGASMQFMMPLVPFLNAKLQTTYRLVENEKGDKRRLWTLGIPQQIFLRGLVLTAFSLMAYGLNLEDDEEKWDKIPPYMKLNYDIIPFMGNYITLPRAFEIGQVFGALPIFVLDAIRRGEGKDLAEALVEVGKNTFWMNPIPKAIDPILGAYTNYDFFRGRPLETKGEQALPVGERINRSTTKTGEALSAAVNMVFGNVLSPIKAQALLDGYTGTLGVALMNGFDSLLAAAGAIPGKPAGAFGDPASMPGMLANFTGMNRFYREDAQMVSRFVGDFYKIKEMTDQLVRSQNLARQAGDFNRLQELRGEEGLPLQMRSAVNAASEQISDLNKRIRLIERRDMDAVAKAEQIEPLIRRRDDIAKRVVDRARNIGAF